METRAVRWPNWIGIVVDDLEAQRRFYGETLGLLELGSGEGWVHFDMGFPNILELLERSEEPEYDRVRYQVGFAVDDIVAVRKGLIRRGATPITEIDGGPDSQGRWAYFRDPEGNVFEISERLGTGWDT